NEKRHIVGWLHTIDPTTYSGLVAIRRPWSGAIDDEHDNERRSAAQAAAPESNAGMAGAARPAKARQGHDENRLSDRSREETERGSHAWGGVLGQGAHLFHRHDHRPRLRLSRRPPAAAGGRRGSPGPRPRVLSAPRRARGRR